MSRFTLNMRVLFATLALAISSGAGAALVINNTADTNGSVGTFGPPGGTATYGEAFHTNGSDTYLNSFSMMFRSGTGSMDVKGYIGAWDGSKVTSILYTSSVQTVNSSGGTLTFSDGVQLAANTGYIAFLSYSELPVQPPAFFSTPTTLNDGINNHDTDPFTDGFFYLNNGTDEAAWFGNWVATASVGDIALLANLDVPAAAVPEPGSLALLGLGLAGLAVMRRRRA